MDEKKDINASRKIKNKRNRLNLRIDDSELETLNNICFEENASASQVIRTALKVYNAIRKNKNV